MREESQQVSPLSVSILVPSFNSGGYLVEAIASIADQLIPGDEVLVQDGASTDDSLKGLRDRFGEADWLTIVSEPDHGQSDALQKAMDRATNDYIVWLNADDVVYPDKLDSLRKALESGPDLVIGRSMVFDNSGRVLRTYTPNALTRKNLVTRGDGLNFFSGSMAMRRSFVQQSGGFDATYQYCMDVDLLARMIARDPVVVYLPDVIGGLRWHSESKGGSTIWPIVTEGLKVRLEHAAGGVERVQAVAASAGYLLAGLMQPLRHTKIYSRVHAQVVRKTIPTV